MGVAAAGVVRAAVALVRRVADVVTVVGNCLDVGERVRVHVLAGLSLVAGTLNHVIEVRNYTRGAERLAVVVPIDAPRIACAFGKDFEGVSRGVVPPNAGIDGSALGVWRAGFANARMR